MTKNKKTKQFCIFAKTDEVEKMEFILNNSECSKNSEILRKAIHVLYLQTKSNVSNDNKPTENAV